METKPRVVQDTAQEHVCISLPLDPESTEHLVPPPPSSSYPSSPRRPRTMDSNYYPRADSDSEDSTHKTEGEEHLPEQIIPKLSDSPPTFSPTPSSFSPLQPTEPATFRRQPSLSDDLLCTICASLLHDPMSLHCGHSFCQICLAAMWKNSNNTLSAVELKCPVCRSSWRNFPGVNIQLRNIIERNHPQACVEREESMTEEDRVLLARFRQAREKESQWKDKAVPHLRREEIRRLVTGLCCIFAILITLLTVVFSLVMWTWVGAEGEFMRKPVSQWNQRDVAEWVGGLGTWATKNYSDIFLHEHITGLRLLKLDEDALKLIGIKDSFRQQSILYGIQELKEADFNTPRNFYEYKAGHRRQTLMVAVFFSVWPRFTTLFCYTFHYHDIFLPLFQTNPSGHELNGFETEMLTEEEKEELKEPSAVYLIVIFLLMLLAPHVLVAHIAWSWAGEYPLIAYPVLLHCAWEIWREGKELMTRARSGNWAGLELMNWSERIIQLSRAAVRMTIKNAIFFAIFFVVFWLLWHITPYFLCDLLFGYFVWHTALYLLLWTPLQKLRRLCGGGHFRAQIRMNFNRPAVVNAG